ncbi:PIN domain-like protein [Amanita rubescens]|nr:PIN domain-like protein [Amanita rubescens]
MLLCRKVAIDASMSIYQFLIAVRQKDEQPESLKTGSSRRICLTEPPELKKGVLSIRFERQKEAKEEGEEAKETETAEDIYRFSRRTAKVTSQHNEECRKLLALMGIPVVIAPSEPEAQCAELAKGGKALPPPFSATLASTSSNNTICYTSRSDQHPPRNHPILLLHEQPRVTYPGPL